MDKSYSKEATAELAEHIYKTSFSKYGTAYQMLLEEGNEHTINTGGILSA